VLARHDVKTAYVGSMCGTLVARRGETDINGVHVFTRRLATRRVAGPVAEAEGGRGYGAFLEGLVPIAQRGNPREDVEDLLSAARFNRSSCTVTRALLDLMLEKTPLRLQRSLPGSHGKPTVSTPNSRGGRDGVGKYRHRPQVAVRRRSLRIYRDSGISATRWWGKC